MIADRPIEDLLSFVTVTHYSPRKSYGKLSPPSDGIVRETIRSFRQGIPGLKSFDQHVVFNKPNGEKYVGGPEEYKENLQYLSKDLENVALHTRENRGLGPGILEGLKHVETPLVLFVEHDWELIESIDIDGILETFENFENVQSIRFNKRPNEESLWDTTVTQDYNKPVPLCKVSSVGNHPQVVRTEQLREWVERSKPALPTMLKGFWYHYSTPQSAINYAEVLYEKYIQRADIVRKFDDVEFVLDTKFKSDIKSRGFENAHRDWGVYLYGNRGDGPYTQHLGR